MSKEESKPESFSRDDVKAMMDIARKQGVRTRDIESDKAFTDLYKRMADAETELSELRKENERLTEVEDCNKRTILSLKQERGEIESQLSKAKELLMEGQKYITDPSYEERVESFLKS